MDRLLPLLIRVQLSGRLAGAGLGLHLGIAVLSALVLFGLLRLLLDELDPHLSLEFRFHEGLARVLAVRPRLLTICDRSISSPSIGACPAGDRPHAAIGPVGEGPLFGRTLVSRFAIVRLKLCLLLILICRCLIFFGTLDGGFFGLKADIVGLALFQAREIEIPRVRLFLQGKLARTVGLEGHASFTDYCHLVSPQSKIVCIIGKGICTAIGLEIKNVSNKANILALPRDVNKG